MSLLLNYKEYIYISYNDFILIFNTRTKESKLLNTLECSQNIMNISCICLSEDNSLFSICDDEKSLLVFDTNNWKIVNKITVNKRVTSMVFTKKKNILLADKSGDVYEYSTVMNSLTFLMGHVSMLLHLTLCKNDTYLATCDRDEKIRISHYPDCYEIQEYCLFHTDFVSQILYLEDHDLLISGSGDGHLVIWDYINGKDLDSIDCLEYLPKIIDSASKVCQFSVSHLNGEDFNEGCKKMNNQKKEADNIKGRYMDGATNKCRGCDIKKIVYAVGIQILAVAFERWNCILLFYIEDKKFIFVQHLQLKGDVLDLSFNDNNLLVLQNLENGFFDAFSLSKDVSNNILISSYNYELISYVNEHEKLFKGSKIIESNFASLHKIHIDNISDYVERKRKRIIDMSNKNSCQIKKLVTE